MPRVGLTRERVVAEAAALADEVGFGGLGLSPLARRLGVAVPSLYKHVPGGLPALQREVSLLAIRELGEALRGSLEAPRRERLAALARAYRAYALAHPGRYAATVRAPDPADAEWAAASDAVLRVVFDVLAGYGLSGVDAIDATRALRAALHGFVALETLGGFGLPRDVERSFERLVEICDAALRTWRPRATGRSGAGESPTTAGRRAVR
jgi:AcrR family transcriptional regulator